MNKANLMPVLGVLALSLLLSACPAAPATPSPAAQATAAATVAAVAPTATATVAPTTTPQPAATQALATAVGSSQGPLRYDMVVTAPGEPQETMKLASKAGKMRMEFTADGKRTVLLADTAAGTAYIWLPDDNQALKLPSLSSDVLRETPFDAAVITQEVRRAGTRVGTETVDGQAAEVWEYVEDGEKSKIWISQQSSLPLRVETQTPEGITKVEFRNHSTEPIADSEFALPAGVTVLDMGSLMTPPTPTPGR